jgi:hypothetical protein
MTTWGQQNEILTKVGRETSSTLLDYINYVIELKDVKRELNISIILDNRNHPIFEYKDKVKEILVFLNNINIFMLKENDSDMINKLEQISEDINMIISYVENYILGNSPSSPYIPKSPLLAPK